MSGLVLGAAGASVIVATGARWLWLINRVRVPRDRTAYLALNGLGAALGVAAFLQQPGLTGGLFAGLAVVGGAAFLALRLGTRQAKKPPAVAIGEPVLDFTALDDQEKHFDLATLRGKPFLLKFFRGHW